MRVLSIGTGIVIGFFVLVYHFPDISPPAKKLLTSAGFASEKRVNDLANSLGNELLLEKEVVANGEYLTTLTDVGEYQIQISGCIKSYNIHEGKVGFPKTCADGTWHVNGESGKSQPNAEQNVPAGGINYPEHMATVIIDGTVEFIGDSRHKFPVNTPTTIAISKNSESNSLERSLGMFTVKIWKLSR